MKMEWCEKCATLGGTLQGVMKVDIRDYFAFWNEIVALGITLHVGMIL